MAAPNTYTRVNEYKIPRGRPAFSRRRDDGTYEGYRFFGNCPAFTLAVETENYQHTNSEGGLNEVDLDVPISVTRTSNVTVDNISNDNLAIWLGAGITLFDQVVTPVTNEAISVLANRTYQLGEAQNESGVRDVGSVTVTVGGTTRANSTAYAKGVVLIPSTPNNHAYLVTVAGTSDAAPPTFPTDGSDVADGTATLLDLGVISTLTYGTDYIVDTALGLVSTPVAGKVGAAAAVGYAAMGEDANDWAGLPILANYTPAANVRTQIRTGSATSVRGRLKFFADNPYGTQQDVLIPDCTIAPSGELPFIGEGEVASIEFAVGISLLNSTTPAVIIEDRGS
ncbi:MAG: hypothetical protein E6Q97_06130 [Desulfurellales bacterium]|nr:MAG: hypothetical protein E6Q97_06130 [Desulfurellales bacterium]